METKIQRIKRFLEQPSTVRGLVGLIGLGGITIAPERIVEVLFGVATVLSLVEIFRDEDKSKPE